jgi:PKD repeat protein
LPAAGVSTSTRVAVAWAASLAAGLLVPAAAAADVPPAAAFTITPNPGIVGLPMVLEDHSGDLDGQITRREWDIGGDGTFELANVQRVVRTFRRPRCVVVSLRVTDNAGNVAQHNAMLTVRLVGAVQPVCSAPPPDPAPIIATPPPPTPNNAPTATFLVSPVAPQVGQLVSFSSTASDSDGSVVSQEWDLDGDGTFADATGPSAQTTFTGAGVHNVSLRVSDDRGVLVVGTVPVTVVDPSAVPPGGGSGVQGSRQRAPAQALEATVRLRTRVGVKRARVEILSVEAPANSTVTLRCSASRCPAALSVAQVGARERTVHFRRTENRLLYAGTLLQVFVTRSGSIGKYVSFRIRGEMSPPLRRTRCLRPGGMRPYRCL